jgi:aminoglycoside phosphotransferase (APT) family kinase protein
MSWSINAWIPGEPAMTSDIKDKRQFADDLGAFLLDLQSANPSGGPIAGKHNFYRGGDLGVYNDATIKAIKQHENVFPAPTLTNIWNDALSTKWEKSPVWIHGDIAPGNLLVKDGRLCAVIDFGVMGIGDPACDMAMAWTFFEKDSRAVFKKALQTDDDTWNRAKGWALWKALITFDGDTSSGAYHAIAEILNEENPSKV